MGYKIFLSECNRYNIVEVYEPMTHKLAIEQLKALNALIAETGVTNALIDVRNSRFIEPTGVLYLFAYETLAEYNMSKTSKCAVLTAPDDTSHNFLEVAATNAGYNLRIFKDYDEAVNWLNS